LQNSWATPEAVVVSNVPPSAGGGDMSFQRHWVADLAGMKLVLDGKRVRFALK
jgi:hypothetical protein